MSNKRVSLKDRNVKIEKTKTDSFFRNTSLEEDKLKEKDKLKRQTYYLTNEIITALSLYSVYENMDKSQIVRKALKEFIPEEYFQKAKDIK